MNVFIQKLWDSSNEQDKTVSIIKINLLLCWRQHCQCRNRLQTSLVKVKTGIRRARHQRERIKDTKTGGRQEVKIKVVFYTSWFWLWTWWNQKISTKVDKRHFRLSKQVRKSRINISYLLPSLSVPKIWTILLNDTCLLWINQPVFIFSPRLRSSLICFSLLLICGRRRVNSLSEPVEPIRLDTNKKTNRGQVSHFTGSRDNCGKDIGGQDMIGGVRKRKDRCGHDQIQTNLNKH